MYTVKILSSLQKNSIMADPITERYEFETYEQTLEFLQEYPAKNPQKKVSKFLVEFLTDLGMWVLLLTLIIA